MQFDLTASGFSLNNALFCAQLCQTIYGPAYDRSLTWTPPIAPPWQSIQSIVNSTTDTHCAVACDGTAIYVFFRGSASLKNWIADFDAFRANASGIGWCHAGFYNDARSVLDRVIAAIRALDPHLPIVVTGHSLGASDALIESWLLNPSFAGRIHSVYALEPAKPGGAGFKTAYDAALGDRTFCVTNAADLVPWLPDGLGYQRVGQEIFFPSLYGRAKLPLSPDWIKNPTVLRKLWSDKWEFLKEFARLKSAKWLGILNPAQSPLLADHPIGAVIARLEAAQ